MNTSQDQHYRLVVKSEGSAYIQNIDSSNVEPETARTMSKKIEVTANTPTYVYIGYHSSKMRHKIGISKHPEQRARELKIDILHTVLCETWGQFSAKNLEQMLHSFYTQVHIYSGGEWFFLQNMDIKFLSNLNASDYFTLQSCFNRVQTIQSYLASLDRYSVTLLPTNEEIYQLRDQHWYKGTFTRKVGFVYGLRKFSYLASQAGEDEFAADLNGWIRDFSENLLYI